MTPLAPTTQVHLPTLLPLAKVAKQCRLPPAVDLVPSRKLSRSSEVRTAPQAKRQAKRQMALQVMRQVMPVNRLPRKLQVPLKAVHQAVHQAMRLAMRPVMLPVMRPVVRLVVRLAMPQVVIQVFTFLAVEEAWGCWVPFTPTALLPWAD